MSSAKDIQYVYNIIEENANKYTKESLAEYVLQLLNIQSDKILFMDSIIDVVDYLILSNKVTLNSANLLSIK